MRWICFAFCFLLILIYPRYMFLIRYHSALELDWPYRIVFKRSAPLAFEHVLDGGRGVGVAGGVDMAAGMECGREIAQ
jgi:hypothetical protein